MGAITSFSDSAIYKEMGMLYMEPKTVIDFITQLGFPIACVCYLFYAQAKEREAHKAEAEAWTTALHNNTLALQQLSDYIKELKGIMSRDSK